MSGLGDKDFEIRLRNAEGIPVLQVAGCVTKTALRAVGATLDRLASAGHYNIVLNLERAQVSNWRFLAGLAGAVRNIRQHYGAVDIVADGGSVHDLMADRTARLFRVNKSEQQAISRIKRLPRLPEGIAETNARLK